MGNTGKLTHHAPCYIWDGGFFELDKEIPYAIEKSKPIFKENSFAYDVLYQGKIGNKIKISFREFTKDIARPAFTQDIEYELEKDGTTTVGFKGLRIEVIKTS